MYTSSKLKRDLEEKRRVDVNLQIEYDKEKEDISNKRSEDGEENEVENFNEKSSTKIELLRDVTILTQSDLIDLLPNLDETKPWEYTEPVPETPRTEKEKVDDGLIWEGKKKLQSTKKREKILDERVLKTPPGLKKSVNKLLDYLLEYCDTEYEKFRAIFRYIAENVKYDINSLETDYDIYPSINPEDILKKGIAVCEGFSYLFQHLCREAGLECKVITGYAKGPGYYPGKDSKLHTDQLMQRSDHVWNTVLIDGEEYFCDCTWAAGYIDATTIHRKYVRKYDDDWFICEPQAFKESHFPIRDIENLEISTSDFTNWDTKPQTGIGFHKWEVDLVSHPNKGLISTKNSSIDVKIRCAYPLQIGASIELSDENVQFNGNNKDKKDYNSFVKTSLKNDIHTAHVRIFEPGVPFALSFYANEPKGEMCKIVSYTIEGKGESNPHPFPIEGPYLGVQRQQIYNGYQICSNDGPIINTNGSAEIEIIVPEQDKELSFMVKLYHDGIQRKGAVFSERVGYKLRINVLLTNYGDHVLKILREDITDNFYHEIINCLLLNNKAYKSHMFPDTDIMYGPNADFVSSGMTFMNTETYRFVDVMGEVALCIKLPKKRVMFNWSLVGAQGAKIDNVNRRICVEVSGDIIRYRLRLPQPGFYLFHFNNLIGFQNGFPFCKFLLQCQEGYTKSLFPVNEFMWGPTKKFYDYKMAEIKVKCSTMITTDGEFMLKFHKPKNIHLMTKLKNSRGFAVKVSTIEFLDSGNTCEYCINVKPKGFFSFEIFGSKSINGSHHLVASYLLENR